MPTVALSELDEPQLAVAVQRWQLLRPVVEDGVPLAWPPGRPRYRCAPPNGGGPGTGRAD